MLMYFCMIIDIWNYEKTWWRKEGVKQIKWKKEREKMEFSSYNLWDVRKVLRLNNVFSSSCNLGYIKLNGSIPLAIFFSKSKNDLKMFKFQID